MALLILLKVILARQTVTKQSILCYVQCNQHDKQFVTPVYIKSLYVKKIRYVDKYIELKFIYKVM